MKDIKRMGAVQYSIKDVLLAAGVTVLVFIMAYFYPVIAISLTAYFSFLNLMRLDKRLKDVNNELAELRRQ